MVDSFSDDETVEIARSFPKVRVVQRAFDFHRNQWEFGLKETGISTPWVLALDADYVVTSEFVAELESFNLIRVPLAIARTSSIASTEKNFAVASIRRSPSSTVAMRLPTFRMGTRSESRLKEPSKNCERRCFTTIASRCDAGSTHRRATRNSKRKNCEAQIRPNSDSGDRLRRWRIVVPPAMLVYCLIVRGGIFDGWAGFYYAFQRTAGGVDAGG